MASVYKQFTLVMGVGHPRSIFLIMGDTTSKHHPLDVRQLMPCADLHAARWHALDETRANELWCQNTKILVKHRFCVWDSDSVLRHDA